MKTLMETDVHPVPVGSVGYIHFRPDTPVMVPVDMRGYSLTKTRAGQPLGGFSCLKKFPARCAQRQCNIRFDGSGGSAGLGRASLFDSARCLTDARSNQNTDTY